MVDRLADVGHHCPDFVGAAISYWYRRFCVLFSTIQDSVSPICRPLDGHDAATKALNISAIKCESMPLDCRLNFCGNLHESFLTQSDCPTTNR
jgi:hypothetical protein